MRQSPDRIAAADRAIAALDTAARASNDGAGAGPAFCIAAGQAYWLGRRGNPYQARAFLLDGFQLAQARQTLDLSALAAFRLSVVAASATNTSTRGLRKRALTATPAQAATPTTADTDSCAVVRSLAAIDYAAATVTAATLSCAIGQARVSGDRELFTRATLRLARFWLAAGRRNSQQLAPARDHIRDLIAPALGPAAGIVDPGLRTVLLGRLVDTAVDAGALPAATLQPAVDAMRAAAGSDPVLEAVATAAQARIALLCGDQSTGRSLLRRAIFLEMQAPLPTRLADWYLLAAEADPAARDQDLDAALNAINQLRPLLGTYDPVTEDSNFAVLIRPVFEAIVDRKLAPAGATAPAEIAEAQSIVEQYRQAELQSVFGSSCVTAQAPLRPADLKPGELLLYPVLLPDRIELLYAAGGPDGTPAYHRLPPNRDANREEVLSLVDRLVDVTTGYENDAWREPARRLYDLLIAPVADHLAADGTLIVVPDGPLSALPFGTLVDASGRFLVQRTRISVVPSLAYSQPGGGEARDPKVVAASLEKEVDLPYGSYNKLAAATDEARSAVGAGETNPDRNLLIRDFRRADLINALSQRHVDVLHLATHASFNGRSDRSYIVAEDQLIPISDLRAMIAQNQTRGQELDLLVLSACETAVGDDEASMGLAGTAVQAGARSALASLWQVDDSATATLMKTFYERYRATSSKSKALRDAQIAMITSGRPIAHPYYWASFELLGAWR